MAEDYTANPNRACVRRRYGYPVGTPHNEQWIAELGKAHAQLIDERLHPNTPAYERAAIADAYERANRLARATHVTKGAGLLAFGRRMRSERARLRISMADIAREYGVTVPQVSAFERGKAPLPLDVMRALVERFCAEEEKT